MIHVIATIEVSNGEKEKFLTEFQAIVPEVLNEAGCLEYGPTVDVVTDISAQIPLRENIVTIIEKWESLEHLKAHLVAPHMQTYREKVKDIVVATQLQILQAP